MINFNINHQALQNILNNKQKAEQLAQQNFNLAFSVENFRTNYNRARELHLEIAKLEYSNKYTSAQTQMLNDCYRELQLELNKLNLKPYQLKPVYYCKNCNDTGFISGKECDCLKREKINLVLKANNLSIENLPSFETTNFDVYEQNSQQIMDIFKLAQNFVTQPNTTKLNLIIFGNTGVGKTYLSECILNCALSNNYLPIFLTAYNLSEVFLNYHTANVENKNSIIEPYLTCDLLIIDDLGSERIMNNITREYLYIILSERSKNNLKTVISTNLTPNAIMDVYDERIFSRIVNKRESILVNFAGTDLRLKK